MSILALIIIIIIKTYLPNAPPGGVSEHKHLRESAVISSLFWFAGVCRL